MIIAAFAGIVRFPLVMFISIFLTKTEASTRYLESSGVRERLLILNSQTLFALSYVPTVNVVDVLMFSMSGSTKLVCAFETIPLEKLLYNKLYSVGVASASAYST